MRGGDLTCSSLQQLRQQDGYGVERVQRFGGPAGRHALARVSLAVIPQAHLVEPAQSQRLRNRVDQHRIRECSGYHLSTHAKHGPSTLLVCIGRLSVVCIWVGTYMGHVDRKEVDFGEGWGVAGIPHQNQDEEYYCR